MPKLSLDMADAVLNETLRLMAPLLFLLKRSDDDQVLSIEGTGYNLPNNSPFMLCTAAAHRNPAYWPSNDVKNPYADLKNFRPERWLVSEDSSLLYQPQRNTSFPFSSGARSCLCRRFAHTEVMAALAVIFKDYSVELALDDWVSEPELKNLGIAERNNLWELAAKKVKGKMGDVSQVLTLKMKDEEAPIRFVKRGNELF
jgi:cytochrome P450